MSMKTWTQIVKGGLISVLAIYMVMGLLITGWNALDYFWGWGEGATPKDIWIGLLVLIAALPMVLLVRKL
ncbi:hypothetical protein LZ518_08500 [Sphingomonas sp. RB56-2]|uniref:Uncharacterized protein n=1 Tax=Sphingomonas brevis TaxID=2908206 RepID=A0ABT0S9T8_9SPHN|nr:hypothetical protein [Sphingomonas brevis]MCL6741169.1 hypothetical protein [Sphingomonas brevis]